VDLVHGKTCSFNCVFCQAGKTTSLTLERREYVPVAEVIREFDAWLDSNVPADYVTLAGAGEPTLNSAFGRVIDAVHNKCRIKTAVLSNGSLFHLPAVRADAARSDLVKVSLSAWDQASFTRINRPHHDLQFESVLEGLYEFGSVFEGELWLEVFVVRGINDTEDSMRRMAGIAGNISPDRIHLNTVVRPPAESSAEAVSSVVLEKFSGLFSPAAEIIPAFLPGPGCDVDKHENDIVALVSRHPCRLEDVATLFGNDAQAAALMLERMVAAGKLRLERHGKELFYMAVNGEKPLDR